MDSGIPSTSLLCVSRTVNIRVSEYDQKHRPTTKNPRVDVTEEARSTEVNRMHSQAWHNRLGTRRRQAPAWPNKFSVMKHPASPVITCCSPTPWRSQGEAAEYPELPSMLNKRHNKCYTILRSVDRCTWSKKNKKKLLKRSQNWKLNIFLNLCHPHKNKNACFSQKRP